MSGSCFGSDHAEQNIQKAADSVKVDQISIDCAKDKIMYVYPQDSGFLVVKKEFQDSSGQPTVGLPRYLKVKVDGKKSCTGSRYYFSILEGPLIFQGKYWDVRSPKNQWSVSKASEGNSTLIEEDVHLPPCQLEMAYTGMSLRGDNKDKNEDGIRLAKSNSHGMVAVASIKGQLTYNSNTTNVVMELDIIQPNKRYNISIPDVPHKTDNNYLKTVPTAKLWFRLDAETSIVKWDDQSVGNDRYLHFGRGSAGCFTNRPETTDEWNNIIDDLSRCRERGDGLYIGTIQLTMPDADYQAIEKKLKAYAKKHKRPYIWNNKLEQP